MSITDELREYFGKSKGMFTDYVLAIADRIDVEHEKAMSRAGQLLADAEKDRDYNYAYWQDCKQKVLQHNITLDELSAEIERLEDELAHCIELPKDADGEYIHVGDVMEWADGMTFEVVGIGDGTLFYVESDDADHAEWTGASTKRHHHAPTVEGLLREFALACEDAGNAGPEVARIAAEYAKRLTLAEEDA